ncbi:PRC-barrel domain-containing protein [Telluribacter sp.]|jgi:sporulation protein YlmC with PRC-barrel domain|uniref:PRC-barrel domain-containing protein n=1 Tax=Telluribacter sp. TaxID=1978767 RepID=UPI002E119C8F|nr:PRC-barrel domain-containing protein [Telluribacter sp.]
MENRNVNDERSTTSGENTLFRLNEISGYDVADHSPDIRGWAVRSRDGRKIGRVKDLIFDKTAMKVRYMDLELEKEYMADSDHSDIHLLVPIGAAHVDKDEDFVVVDRIMTHDELQRYPRSGGGFITRDYEQAVVNYHNGANTSTSVQSNPGQTSGSKDDPIIAYDSDDDQTFYNKDCFREDNLYRNRRV